MLESDEASIARQVPEHNSVLPAAEMKERLRMRGFIIPETESDGLEDAAFADEGDDEDES